MAKPSTSRHPARSKRKESLLAKSPAPENAVPAGPSDTFPIVAIGASAGGLEALTLLVEHLTPDLGLAYVIVEHLDPHHKSMLVELLARQTTIPVQEVTRATPVAKDHIYVIPPNRNLYLEQGELRLAARGSFPARHMPIDFLFRTVALECPGNCIGVVLSGTGSDGSLGITEIKAAGGITFAQEPDSARHDGMPRSAIGTGQVDYVLNSEGIARELARIARHPFTKGKPISSHSDETHLQRIFTTLRTRTSVDFRHYKQNTIKRRIFRRMALLKIDKVGQYLQILLDNQKEIEALYQDLLIKVTCFFREPASFKILLERAFSVIVQNRLPQEPIRIWVPGCSSGEEVYSIAITLLEYLGDSAGSTPLQIFGTDISDPALERARTGLYIENIALDVSPARLRRWFVRVDRGYQISKQIREMCVFARQNVTSDPPFSRIDLISCRNLLIYLDAVFQARVMPIFHYALKPHGFLMLGSAESVGNHGDFFQPVDKSARVYGKKMPGPVSGVSFARRLEQHPQEQPLPMVETHRASDVQLAADHFILSRFAPAGVIIDDDFKIVHFRGATGDYLEPAPGRASLHLLKMARGTLSHELRSLVQEARSSGHPVRKDGIKFTSGRATRELALEVAPIREQASAGRHFLILFEESPAANLTEQLPAPAATSPPSQVTGLDEGELRRELTATQSHLQSTIEDFEATTEELKSANEEIMSSNEELQSTNEELETAKEELQSANEELTTVNDEVQARNQELSLLNNDLTNFLDGVNVPVVMLDHALKIRRFTPTTQRVFNLIPADIGRPFGDIKPKVHLPHIERLVAHVIDSVTVHEQEVVDNEGHYYHLSIRPYRTPENKIDGAVLVFVDIDTIKRASLQLEEAKNYAEAIVEAVFDPLLVLDSDFTIQRANSAYYRLFRTDARQTENRSLFALDKSQWDLPAIRQLLRSTFKRRKTPPVEITETFPRIGERTLLVHSRPLAHERGKRPLILLTMSDITGRRQAENEREALRLQLEQERTLFEAVLRQLGMGVAIFGAPDGRLILANEGLRTVLKRRLPAFAHVSFFRQIRATHALDGGRAAAGWPMERSLAQGDIVPYQEITLTRPGAERTVLQVSSSPVYNAQRRMIAVVALFQDITERKWIKDQIVEISAREQRRIAHDLHDGLGQELAAIGYRIKALQARLARVRSPEAEEAGKIGHLTESVLGHTRDLVRFVQPVALDARGLMRSLKDLALSSSRSFRVECTFSCPRPVTLASQDLANNVFRIAQEAVHNAMRHGKPRRIAISLVRRSGGRLELRIVNDGVDFSLPTGLRKRGLGLHIMTYRANIIGGELTVKKNQPRGTVVKCLFPAKVTL